MELIAILLMLGSEAQTHGLTSLCTPAINACTQLPEICRTLPTLQNSDDGRTASEVDPGALTPSYSLSAIVGTASTSQSPSAPPWGTT